MAVLLPLATLLLGKALSKTKQHKAVCFTARCLPSPLHTADDTCKFAASPGSPGGQRGCSAGAGAVGTYSASCLASDGVQGWKLHSRASPAHTKAASHVTDLGYSFRRHGAFR